MSPFLAYHATGPRRRPMILRTGGLRDLHSRGAIWVYSDEINQWGESTHGTWGAGPTSDLWSVAYIGPMEHDPLISNGIKLLTERVTFVTLVTGAVE